MAESGEPGRGVFTMPRLFYKVVVGSAFGLAGIVLVVADALVAVWLSDRGLGWLSYVVLLISPAIPIVLYDIAADYVRRA